MASTCRRGFLYKLTLKNSRRPQRESCLSACVHVHRAPSVRRRGAGPRGLSTHCPCQRYGAWNAAGGPRTPSALVGPLLSRRVWDLSQRPQGRGGTMEVMQPSSGTHKRGRYPRTLGRNVHPGPDDAHSEGLPGVSLLAVRGGGGHRGAHMRQLTRFFFSFS